MSRIFKFLNFDDGILEQVGTVCYICRATALKYKTRRRYKTKRLPTDFWPTLYNWQVAGRHGADALVGVVEDQGSCGRPVKIGQ